MRAPVVFGQASGMARRLKFEYAGAGYHVMVRGDGGKAIFIAKEARLFVHRLVMLGAGRVSVS